MFKLLELELEQALSVCSNYALNYDVKFNAKKSQLIIFKCDSKVPPDPNILVNGDAVKLVSSVVHLGHLLKDRIYANDTAKCISDFNRQCNMFFAKFKYANSSIRNYLFNRYCNNFYGVQMLPIFDDSMNSLYTCWRKEIRRVWRIPWRAHCKLLSHIAGTMDPVFFLCMKCIKFIQSASRSGNSVVKTITGIGLCNTHSIMGANARCLNAVYSMDVAEVALSWKTLCETESDRICTSVQIR